MTRLLLSLVGGPSSRRRLSSSSSSSSCFRMINGVQTAAARTRTATRSFAASSMQQQQRMDSSSSSSYYTVKRKPMTPHPMSSKKPVPSHISRPPYAPSPAASPTSDSATTSNVLFPFIAEQIIVHDEKSISRMRKAAKLARQTLDLACSLAEPGITTDEIDTVVHETIIASGAYPSPLDYCGFPKSLCSSINEVICHGIPDKRPLQFGDIVSFDVSCFIPEGVHGDNCATVIVGDSQDKDTVGVDWRGVPYLSKFNSPEDEQYFWEARRLVETTLESLYAGIDVCRPGGCLSDIGAAIEDVADREGYSSVRKYRGHGIGTEFHCPPFIRHYRNDEKLELQTGMIFTIEPMLTQGPEECFEWDDNWTVSTVDGGLSAQFEHTVLITDDSVEILTVP